MAQLTHERRADARAELATWIAALDAARAEWGRLCLVEAGLTAYPEGNGRISRVASRGVVMLPLRPGLCYRRADDGCWHRSRAGEAFVMRGNTWQARDCRRPYDQLKVSLRDDHCELVRNTDGVKAVHVLEPGDRRRWTVLLDCLDQDDHDRGHALALLLGVVVEGLRSAPRPGKSERRFRLLCEHLREHLAQEHSRDSLAAVAQCHPSHVTRLFVDHAGCSYAAWLEAERLDLVRILLRDTDLDLAAIAQRCGFASANYLVRRFRAQTGMTPGRWRRP
ncbi:MAG: AraC family transcriptional regulator [Planctomycetota bacterium]|jgi:AraC-like DNA-binding protein|nr:AraC family transcriptional regulator [Planctomycetota bacterium]